jgi:sulfate transport system ATP-binding protein
MSISIRNINKQFGSTRALCDINMDVPSGSLLALLGPSGSGKTTLLRIIAGLETSDTGSVLYHEEDVTHSSPRDRNVGFVFQHYALFRHMSVFENIAFGMRVRGAKGKAVTDRVQELLRLVRLEGMEKRFPSQLSGGQRQRVALARALAVKPRMLLLDEPFGALDAKVRQELRAWLRELHDETRLTTVFVTHDQEEAFEVADLVAIMGQGRIEQFGSPHDVYTHPATPFVMDFLGNVNVVHGSVQAGKAMMGGMELAYPDYQHDESREARAYIRPHELEIDRTPTGEGSFRVKVLHINQAGPVVKVRVLLEDLGWYWNVDVPQERFQELKLGVDQQAYVFPRRFRLFIPQDYVI